VSGAAVASAPAAAPPERADLATWLAVLAGTLAAFMALLDTSIVNAALPVIQGEIGATPSEGTWLGTSYLVAEIVIMPLTAWFERLFGLRRVLLVGAVLFTVFSVVCGFATDLETMILGRVGQGLSGGVMIPTGMTILAKRLPPSQQSIGMALFASAALLGPIVGPLLGGWITENASWHYAFFINVPICAVLVLLIVLAVPPDAPGRPASADADWFGVFGIMVALGALTVLLEEGHREQWFESALIWKLAIASVLGFVFVAIGQKNARVPVLRLQLLRDSGLSSVLFMMSVVGVVLFSTLFTVPQFLAGIADYNALQAGLVLSTAGAVSIVGALFYPVLVARVHVRVLVAFAFCFTAAGSLLSSRLTGESDGAHFFYPLMLLGIGTTFSAIPLQQAALSAVNVDDSGEATSMFNISRNIGGSVGLAVLSSVLDQRIAFHHWRLMESIAANDPAAWQRLTEYAQVTGAPDGAYRLLDAQVMREALVMSFGDIFYMLGIASLVSLPLVFLLKPIDPERAAGMAH
jgi:DHA2 family multidrug resistance protein